MITIRKATIKDLTLLLDWGKEMYEVEKKFLPLLTYSPDESKNRYTKQINDPNFLFLIAEFDNVPVGYLYAHVDKIDYLSTEFPQCEIEVIYLDVKARGMKISGKLIAVASDWAKEKKAFEIKAGIFAKNIASQEAFKKAGFNLQHLTFTKTI